MERTKIKTSQSRKEKNRNTEYRLKRKENQNRRLGIHLLTDQKVGLIELSYQAMRRSQMTMYYSMNSPRTP